MSRFRIAISIAALSLAVTACGGTKSTDSSDSSSSTDTATVCAEVTDLSSKLSGTDAFDQENIAALMAALKDIKEIASAEVKTAIDSMMEYFTALDDLLAEFDYDIEKASADATAVAKLTELSSDEAMSAAGDAIDTWTKDTCGITLGGE
jgi:cytochrome c556